MSANSKSGALLVEARTEELPPQLLPDLANQFPDSLLTNLKRAGFADDDSHRERDEDGNPKLLATPRRVAALLKNIRRAAPDRMLTRRGPQVASALDKDGRPTKALEGFLRATGSQFGDLRKLTERGREYFAVDLRETGGTLDAKLAGIVQETLLSLNAPRLMRWGDNDWRFIRPLRGVVMLWGSDAIAGEVMGVQGGRTTLGHRFMSEGKVEIPSATEYESAMEGARVVADLKARRENIADELIREAERLGAWVFWNNEVGGAPLSLDGSGDFLEQNSFLQFDEVATLCENPKVVCGSVGEQFLKLPVKCVALCMQKHQRFFPLGKKGKIDATVELSPHFLAVADNAPEDMSGIADGYNRVLSARLADLSFYLEEDRKANEDECREKLKCIAYHEKLGSQFDRVGRIRAIARAFAKMLGESEEVNEKVDRAAAICKLDLPSLTVGEHPELAGYVAAQCFANDNDQIRKAVIRKAVEYHERTGLDGKVGPILALANHMEKLVGFFGIGEKPTGSKDPFGLRRSAADVASILMGISLRCDALIDTARESFGELPNFDRDEIYGYIAERLRQNDSIVLIGAGTMEMNAILSDANLSDPRFLFESVRKRAEALVAFRQMPEAAALIEANKRINNIFRKSGVNPDDLQKVDAALFQHEEEDRLLNEIKKIAAKKPYVMVRASNFHLALRALSSLAAPLDAFFEKVMVNADEPGIRANRFALLAELRKLLNQVADISKLAG